jgi:hypothetical protein
LPFDEYQKVEGAGRVTLTARNKLHKQGTLSDGRAFSFALKKGATMSNKGEMLVSRIQNLWRKPLPRPVRNGKTKRERAHKAPLLPSRIATPEEMAVVKKA